MLNRALIRTRVLQTLYAYRHRGELSMKDSLSILNESLSKTYDLYIFLLDIVSALTHQEAELIEARRKKHLATERELNPNTRFIDNKIAQMIDNSLKIGDWAIDSNLSWREEESLLRQLLQKIYHTEAYDNYMNSPVGIEYDKVFWSDTLKKIVFTDENLAEYIESKSIYWDNELNNVEKIESENAIEDLDKIDEIIEEAKSNNTYSSQKLINSPTETIKDFVIKTIKKLEDTPNIDTYLLPMYKDRDDENLANILLRNAIMNFDEYMLLIEKHLSSAWDKDRLADLDIIIMILAITEFYYLPLVPTTITINEYVELAKSYSTAKSSSFVNGILDAIANDLKNEKKILKN